MVSLKMEYKNRDIEISAESESKAMQTLHLIKNHCDAMDKQAAIYRRIAEDRAYTTLGHLVKSIGFAKDPQRKYQLFTVTPKIDTITGAHHSWFTMRVTIPASDIDGSVYASEIVNFGDTKPVSVIQSESGYDLCMHFEDYPQNWYCVGIYKGYWTFIPVPQYIADELTALITE